MSFDPIPTLNEQILTAIGATVADQTEKQNAADAIESFLQSNNFVKEVLNDTLCDCIKDDFGGAAIIKVDSENVITKQAATAGNATTAQAEIKKAAKRSAIQQAIQQADQNDILGQNQEDFINSIVNQ